MPDLQVLKKLRSTPYHLATEEQKEAWLLYGDILITQVVPRWKSITCRVSSLFGDIVTVFDEAFLLWNIQLKIEEWTAQATSAEHTTLKRGRKRKAITNSVAESANSESGSKEGQSCNTMHADLHVFSQLFSIVKRSREQVHVDVWEEELQKQLMEMHENRKKKSMWEHANGEDILSPGEISMDDFD